MDSPSVNGVTNHDPPVTRKPLRLPGKTAEQEKGKERKPKGRKGEWDENAENLSPKEREDEDEETPSPKESKNEDKENPSPKQKTSEGSGDEEEPISVLVEKYRQTRHRGRKEVTEAQMAAVLYTLEIGNRRKKWNKDATEKRSPVMDEPWVKSPTSTSPESLYSSLAMSRTGRNIRLVRLCEPSTSSGGAADTMVKMVMVTTSLDEAIEYDALSYAWGDRSTRRQVLVNGQHFFVTASLEVALATFRQTQSVPGWMWIDAICINQNDFPERNHQVGLMRDIFSHARDVRIWLGPAVDGVKPLFEYIDRVARRERPRLQEHARSSTEEHTFWYRRRHYAALGDKPMRPDRRRVKGAVEMLCRCTWWRRLWTLQEAALAVNPVNPVVHCGDHWVPFEFLQQAIGDIDADRCVLVSWQKLYGDRADISTDLSVLRPFSTTFCIAGVRNSSAPWLLDLLVKAALHETELDHDRVYALLGLVPGALDVVPSYETPIDQVFADATISLLKYCNQPAVLSLAGTSTVVGTDFPSWVFHFGKGQLKHSLSLYRDELSQPLPNLGEFTFETPSAGQLLLQGRQVDVIECCGEPSPHLSAWKILRRHTIDLAKLRGSLATWYEFACVDRNQGAPFWWLLLDGIRDIDRLWSMKNLEDWVQSGKGNDALDETSPQDLNRVAERLSGNRCFMTKRGRLGIGPGEAEPGDLIAVFAGSDDLHVIRPVETSNRTGAYQLIGSSCCEGYEHGKAISDAARRLNGDDNKLDKVFSDILLV